PGDVAHVNPGGDDRPSLGENAQCRRDQRADRREQDRRVELLRRALGRAPRPGPGGPRAAVADQAGAEQRCGPHVVVRARYREAEAQVRDHPLGVAAVERVAGEAGKVAEVFAASPAVAALAARPAEPRDTEATPVARHATDL